MFRRVTDLPSRAGCGHLRPDGPRASSTSSTSSPSATASSPACAAGSVQADQRLYDRQDRAAGKPKQTLRRLIKYAMDGMFSFSYKPLRVAT